LYEVFTLPQLIQAFDLSHVTRRKAAVSQSRLDFLNKMTLRRKAGIMGKDEEVVAIGKEGLGGKEQSAGKSRKELIERLQGMLRDVKVLKDW